MKKQDAELLERWEQWKRALAHELSATDQRTADRRHAKVREIERRISETPAETATGATEPLWPGGPSERRSC